MSLSLIVMALIGLASGLLGLPLLLTPAAVRRGFGWRDTPHLAVVMRIVGAMLASLCLILIVFAVTYARSAAQP
jgi:hypothetical protein